MSDNIERRVARIEEQLGINPWEEQWREYVTKNTPHGEIDSIDHAELEAVVTVERGVDGVQMRDLHRAFDSVWLEQTDDGVTITVYGYND